MKNTILIKNSLIEVPVGTAKTASTLLGTVISNLSYYGFIPSKETYGVLSTLGDSKLKTWWSGIESTLKEVSGDSKNMDKYVVYKNFPAEVLEKTKAEYWISQILMYWGLPNELFTETEVKRDLMFEKTTLKVLQLANADSLKKIYSSLTGLPNRLTKEQLSHVLYIFQTENIKFDASQIPFKENMINVIVAFIDAEIKIKISSAMDVLRLAVGLSGGDVSFKEQSKFKNFSRKQRRFLLSLLDECSNLAEDVARDKEKWKILLHNLHPNDYRNSFKNVCKVYDLLYNDKVTTFNGKIETLLKEKDIKVLDLLQSRPGEFVRRLHNTLNIFDTKAAISFIQCAEKLNTIQLLKIQKYLQTINNRKFLTIAPKGNWTKMKVLENKKSISDINYNKINKKINSILGKRINNQFKKGVSLDSNTNRVKLQTNDSEMSPYGRGTVFPIPDNVDFIRSTSYWQCQAGYNTWFDNGWNFFNADWKSLGACCWTIPHFTGKRDSDSYWYSDRNTNNKNAGAVFSGDPTNSKTADGKACQMIDLYIDKLIHFGVRYAVWNILCFSRIKFNQAEEVYAALQWGEDAQKGKLFEPSRCQLNFPIKGDTFTKYIAMIDLVERKLIYIDANLKSSVSNAASNGPTLEEQMPAFMEYLEALPSVHDLFKNAKKSENGTVVSYDDKNLELKGKKAYIFRNINANNKFEQLNIAEVLK